MGEFAKGFDLRRKEPCDHQRWFTYFIGKENESLEKRTFGIYMYVGS